VWHATSPPPNPPPPPGGMISPPSPDDLLLRTRPFAVKRERSIAGIGFQIEHSGSRFDPRGEIVPTPIRSVTRWLRPVVSPRCAASPSAGRRPGLVAAPANRCSKSQVFVLLAEASGPQLRGQDPRWRSGQNGRTRFFPSIPMEVYAKRPEFFAAGSLSQTVRPDFASGPGQAGGSA